MGYGESGDSYAGGTASQYFPPFADPPHRLDVRDVWRKYQASGEPSADDKDMAAYGDLVRDEGQDEHGA